MDCNCININNGGAVFRHVYGNVLRMAIPLTVRTVELVDGEATATDADFIPSQDYPVEVVLQRENRRAITIEATMRDGNIAYIEDLGTVPVGQYAITVMCKDDNGNPYRFKQNDVLNVVDTTAEAGIEKGIEYDVTVWYLDSAIYLVLKGEDGVGIEDIVTETSDEIGGTNTITIVLSDGRQKSFTVLNGSGAVDGNFNPNSNHPVSNSVITERFNAVDTAIAGLFGDVDYDSQTKSIRFYNKNKSAILATLDAKPFIKDGMVNSVYISNNTLVITFNTDAGREAIGVPLTSVFNPNNYYTKVQVDSRIATALDNLNMSNYYTKSQTDRIVGSKADVSNDGKVPASEATPVVLDYIYAPAPGPVIPINPQAGEVIYFANEHKIRRYYYEYAGQSGGLPAIVYVEETPSKHVVYYNKGNEKFYRYDAGSLSMVEIETGRGDGTVTGVKVGSTTYEPTDGVVDISASIPDVDTAIAGLADVARTGDYDDLENKPTIPDVSNLATKSELQSKADASNVYTKLEVDNALALKQGNITDLDQIRAGATLGASSYQKPHSGIPASDLADGVIPDVSGFVTTSDVADAVADLVDSAPATLDTLKELADALGDDPNFATTMTTALGNKVDKVSGKGLSTEDYTTAEKTKLANLATVATTGSYNDLTDKPVIPEGTDLSGYYDKTEVDGLLDDKVDKVSGKGLSTNDYTDAEKTKLAGIASGAEANVQADWEQTITTADDYIKNKPTLATVATSGSYNDLQDKPTIPVAYDDTTLSGRVSALENAGFITTETDPNVPNWAKADTKPTYTAQEVGALPASTTIPTKTSDLTNDSGFIDKAMSYGTCDTAASTMPKVCTVETFPTYTDNGVTHAKEGAIIAVKFTNSDTNTTDAPELNVNGIGAKAIMYNNAIVTSTAKNTTVAGTAKMIAFYRYDSSLDEGNGAWEFLAKSVDSNSTYSQASLGQGYAVQSNSAAATAITASISSYSLSTGGIVSIKFTYDVPASATLNINSKGAKAIYNQGAAIAAGVIKAGDTATFIYSTYYHLISVDSWQEKQDAISDLATIRSGASAGATAIQSSDLATVATTGAYSDLSGKPSLATVATSGSYNDLSNKPTLFSGNYNDLTNKPSIPAAQVNADWNASSGVMEILNKPTIPTKFSDLVDDSDYITAQDVASIVVGSADVVITETASHINITFVTTSISFTPNTTMSLWAGQKVGTLTVSGTHLKQDITLTVPSNFTAQVSGGTAAQSITIPQTGGEVTGVSVTITYTGADSGSYNGSITATSGTTTASVGLVYSQYQGATIIAGTIGTINAAIGGSRIGELNVSGVNLEGDITASVGNGDFTICATQNGTYGTTATISKASAEASGGATLFVKYTPSSGTSTASENLTLTTPRNGVNMSKTVTLTGAVVSLTVSESSLSFSTTVGTPAAQTFTVRGANLSADISISVSGTGFSVSPATIDKDNAGTAQTVTVTYNPSAAGTNTGTVTIQSSGLSETIDLSGTAEAVPEFSASNSYQQKIGGIYYKVIMNGDNPTNNLQVCNSSYSGNAAANSYSGDVVIPSTVSALLDGNQTPFSVTEIRANAFSSCSSLNSVIVPDSVTSLGNYCFAGNNAMEKIVLGSGCTDLSHNEFYNNISQWEEIDFGENITSVAGNSFKLKDTAIVTLRYAGYNGTTPKRVNFNSAPFSNTNGTRPCAASLYVPSTHVQSYKDSNYWGNPDGGANQQFQQANIFAITE